MSGTSGFLTMALYRIFFDTAGEAVVCGRKLRLMFVDFHSRSAFSFLEGASLPEDLVERAVELEHPAIALMDRDNLCGAPRFYMAAKKRGMTAHIGAEVTGADGNRYPAAGGKPGGVSELVPADFLNEIAVAEGGRRRRRMKNCGATRAG